MRHAGRMFETPALVEGGVDKVFFLILNSDFNGFGNKKSSLREQD